MNAQDRIFSNEELLNVLSLSKNATAIYTTEQLIIQTANDVMIGFWGKDRSVIGKTFEEAVPELIGQPFFDLLREVWRTGVTYNATDTPARLKVDGKLQWFYYDFEYRAIKNEQGEVYCILHTAEDVTKLHFNNQALESSEQREQELNEEVSAVNEELSAANEEVTAANEELAKVNTELTDKIEELHISQESLRQLNILLEQRVASRTKALTESENNFRNMILQAPVAMGLFTGEEMVLEMINDKFLELWDKPRTVVGKPLTTALPELIGQPYFGIMQNVLKTGETYYGNESKVLLKRNGVLGEGYYNFINQPFRDANGNITGIIVVANEVTEQVKAREEIVAANEEIISANEELIATNEELAQAQGKLQKMIFDLAISESRFRFLVQGAPVAIGVLSGRELTIESANDMILKIWGKNADIIGKPLVRALPELVGQPYLLLLDNVFTSGEAYYGNEAPATLEYDGKLQERYFDFIYKPLKDNIGITNTIMVIAVDVTEGVHDRREREKAEEMLRFSVESANAATWYMDAETREFLPSPRLKELFGFQPDAEVRYVDVINKIPEDYRQKIYDAVQLSLTAGETYSMEHPVTDIEGKLRWVRGLGRLYPANGNNRAHFSGLIIDITEQKQDELRKNDFIGMVSHELKTPLTTMSAIVQVLQGKAESNRDEFAIDALNKAYRQARKMTNMINGFLNVSRLESGKIQLYKQDFDLDELIIDMIEESKLTAPGYSISFAPCNALIVNADRDKIGSVISNLLSNAVKYSGKETPIDVKCERIDDMVQISVHDQGIGIKPQDAEKLFERYYRVEAQDRQHISGFGIGLYLSAEIVQRHDGRIWVESKGGVGSTFLFTLPLAGSSS